MNYLAKCKIIIGLSVILFSLIPSSENSVYQITGARNVAYTQVFDEHNRLSTTTKFVSSTAAKTIASENNDIGKIDNAYTGGFDENYLLYRKIVSSTAAKTSFQTVSKLQGQGIPQPQAINNSNKIAATIATTKTTAKTTTATTKTTAKTTTATTQTTAKTTTATTKTTAKTTITTPKTSTTVKH